MQDATLKEPHTYVLHTSMNVCVCVCLCVDIYIYMSPLPFGLMRPWILLTLIKVRANRSLCTIFHPDYSLEV